MSTLLVNAHVVTMDDNGTEHDGGWILFDDGYVRDVGSAERPEADARHAFSPIPRARPEYRMAAGEEREL